MASGRVGSAVARARRRKAEAASNRLAAVSVAYDSMAAALGQLQEVRSFLDNHRAALSSGELYLVAAHLDEGRAILARLTSALSRSVSGELGSR